jgi:starch phosphorylase
LFQPLIDSMLTRDAFGVIGDYQPLVESHVRATAAYLDGHRWTRMSILNVAGTGAFSSDHAVRECCRDVWDVVPSASEGGWR